MLKNLLNVSDRIKIFCDDNRNRIISTIIIGVLVFTFVQSLRIGLHQTSQPTARNLMALSVALSEMEYELSGYVGYAKLLRILVSGIRSFDSDNYNRRIKRALDVDDVSSDGLHFLADDMGYVTYYKLAFRLFGYNIESVFYLYFFLLALSVFIFLITFYNRVGLLNILLLFVCSHFIIIMVTPIIGTDLQVSNIRFLPVLTILPSLYLALLILGNHKINILTLLGAIIQTVILILIIHARSSTIYQLIFLTSISFLAFFLMKKVKKIKGIKGVLKNLQLWPIAIVIVGFIILKLNLMIGLHHSYDTFVPKHNFWCAAIIGLSGHPDSESRYGIFMSDMVCYEIVKRRASERGYSFDIHNIDPVEDAMYRSVFPSPYYTQITTTGIISVSASNAGGHAAFDDRNSTAWFQNDVTSGWLKIDFGAGNKETVTKLRFKPALSSWTNSGIKDFTFEGSNNDSDWTILLSETANNTIYAGINYPIFQEFTFSNSTAYRYYRISILNSYHTSIGLYEVKLFKDGYSRSKEVGYLSFLFEEFCKDEFIEILKQDPRFVLESYLYKIPLFFRIYFSSSAKNSLVPSDDPTYKHIIGDHYFGAPNYLFKWYLLIIIVLGTLFTGKYFQERWFLYLGLLTLQFVFGLLPSFHFLPVNHVIADAGLLFTLIIYTIFSVILCYIFELIKNFGKFRRGDI